MYKFNNINSWIQQCLFPNYLVKPFWGAVIGAGLSLYSANESSKSASKAGDRAADLEQQKIDFAQKQYDDYKTQYGGLEEDMIASIDDFAQRDNLGKYMGENTADVRSSFAGAKDRQKREMGRYGIDPSSGRYQQGERDLQLEETKASVVGQNLAREKDEGDDDKLFARRLAAGSFGKGMSGASTALNTAMGDGATSERATAGRYANEAGSAYGLAGRFTQQAFDGYGGGGGGGGGEEPIWEGSNIVEDSDTGDLGW